jgi:K+-sensing histidine kinase KdpD
MSRKTLPDDSAKYIPLLSGLSHEIRGRVAGICSWLDLHDRSRNEEDHLESIRRMRFGVDWLLLLANELSDAADMLEPSVTMLPFDVLECTRSALAAAARRVPACDFALAPVPAGESWQIKGDGAMMQRAIERLLLVAAPPTHPPPKLTIVLEREPNALVLRVPAGAAAPRVEETLAETLANEGSKQGIGLTFTLAREIMRAHGGDLVLEPGPGGRELVATLPG